MTFFEVMVFHSIAGKNPLMDLRRSGEGRFVSYTTSMSSHSVCVRMPDHLHKKSLCKPLKSRASVKLLGANSSANQLISFELKKQDDGVCNNKQHNTLLSLMTI